MKMLQEAFVLVKSACGLDDFSKSNPVKSRKSASLQLRLFAYYLLFIFVLALAFSLVLVLSGVFEAGKKESRIWMENELAHLSGSAASDFSKLSAQGADFAQQVSSGMDEWFADNAIDPSDLINHPERFEDLLSSQAEALLSILQSANCSGSFLTLCAGNGENSLTGLFFRHTGSSETVCLRGPASVAAAGGIALSEEWQEEFDITGADCLTTVLNTPEKYLRLPLSNLYRWSRFSLDNSDGLLLILPLISQNETVYGVCGLEIDSTLFNSYYRSDITLFPHVLSTLSPFSPDSLDTGAGLFTESSALQDSVPGVLSVTHEDSGFISFSVQDKAPYIGMYQPVNLYSADSPYEKDTWVFALMVPKKDWNLVVNGNNTVIYCAILGFIALSLLLAVFITRRCIRPVATALYRMKTDPCAAHEKTNIAEIDDLLEHFSAQDKLRRALAAELEETRQRLQPPAESLAPNLSAYEEFVRSIDTLSPAESAVFNLYMKGCAASEIADQLCLSMNTIKTHSKRIYTKLNVTSRKELMVYVQMMASELEREALPL